SLPSSQSGQEFNRPNGLRKQCPIQGSSIRKLSRSPPMIRSSWALWVGKPDREFDTSLEVLDVLYIERVGYAVVVGVTYLVLAGWFLVQRHIKFIRKHEAETIFAANHDPLTRLPNRTALYEKLKWLLLRVREGESVALLCLDLDRFKVVNDT